MSYPYAQRFFARQAEFDKKANLPKAHRGHPERDLQNSIIEFLNAKGHFVFKITNRGFQLPSGAWMPPATTGVPDILGVMAGSEDKSKEGCMLAIEVKIKPNRPTPEQVAFLQRITERGGIAIVAYSLKDVENI